MADTATDELGFPFDSISGDRKMSASSWRKMLGELFTDGICATDDFHVQANNSMQLTVAAGNAFVRGAFFPSESQTTLAIESASGTYDRYDAVAIEFNASERKVSLKVVKGGSDSKWPDPSRTDSVYQLFIAVVNIQKGATLLTQDNVKDTRADTWYCGYVTSTGSQERFENELADLKSKYQNKAFTHKDTIDIKNGITLEARWNDTIVEFCWYGNLSSNWSMTGGADGEKFGNDSTMSNVLSSHTAFMFNIFVNPDYPLMFKYDRVKNGFCIFSMKTCTVPKGTWLSGTHMMLR
ncbi:hypothetical protein NQ499_06860 [Catenibacterium mitsuokai]|uniref:hypothetical protein n=1 Tax=Catenibacterium mitsuokai TaxID=100886 RepID=UPI000305E56D|nr:hypothetical protein [Catenibacterium mitsuokai]UWO52002.1 hypothetical protein NQ499_06860 [Catenibacterium mitsuokai]